MGDTVSGGIGVMAEKGEGLWSRMQRGAQSGSRILPSHVGAVANLNRINQTPDRRWLGTRACSRTSCATSGQEREPASSPHWETGGT
ncbi:hypothetical protein MAPG_05679 [Magnaporthiopsis poae ATCC 64411]|uniref:Uncharacterized protein n=1 Tax=Magnaporthiopsis poae (strain ATCC 64411 / 73-15) TaxID=644358 RepID=A0A0C4E013_MAGP6|nr:hypothetical protein MAPG_05679 [Magnaporthiopsis poae ATCC 64411]